MFGLGQIGRLGALASSVARAWSPLSLWPDGISSAGMWISPSDLTSEWQDYTGTTPVGTPGTVADTSNPVGLALDIRAGATVLTDPGNHMLQSTSPARPLMSARVNLLTYTEDFSNGVWGKDGATVSGSNVISETSATSDHRIVYTAPMTVGITYTYTVELEAGTSNYAKLYIHTVGTVAYIDLGAGTVTGAGWTISPNGSGGFFVSGTGVFTTYPIVQIGLTNAAHEDFFAGNPANNIVVHGVQLNIGSTALPYQSIPGDGSTYATDFPIFQKYDGVDDGMATAAFTAGTMIDGMDCMIVVRRDSAALPAIGGLYQADQTKYFGVLGVISGDAGPTYGGCGAPSVFVDNVAVANERGALYDAIGVGDWHILEYRGLDLSAWVNAAWGAYPTYFFNGARGDILLYPSTASTEDKDAARQWLADYYGVTLP